MGLIRTLLALSVVLGHYWPGTPLLVGGSRAVQLFYMISGFLISYVLADARSYDSPLRFYQSRYLRLFPVYAVVALLTLVVYAATGDGFFSAFAAMPASAQAMLAAVNTVILGQDWVLFTAVHDGHLQFSTNYHDSEFPLHLSLVVPQSWTLGVELSFYLLAPFIVRRTWVIVAMLVLSIGVRAWLMLAHGLGSKDPWTYRFFPSELALFMLGALAQRVLLPLYRRWRGERSWVAPAAVVMVMLGCAAYPYLPLSDARKALLLIPSFWLLLPLLFLFQQQVKVDRHIGDLSYPVYIVHMLTLTLASQVAGAAATPYVAVVFTLAGALLLDRCVARPVEHRRQRLRAAQPGAADDLASRQRSTRASISASNAL